MKLRISLFAAAAAALLAAAPAAAQQGFALKGGLVFNSSTVEARETQIRPSDAAGWHLGAEYVLPGGIGLGVSGYTAEWPDSHDVSRVVLFTLAEANYFFRLPLLPVSPYAGVHVGLGTFQPASAAETPRPQVDFGDRGWQVGLRFQPTPLVGLDAQLRRVSGSLSGAQDAGFETRQVLLGVTLF